MMSRKFDHKSKPHPMLSPAAASRRVIAPAEGKASVGHNKYSGRRGPRRNNAIGDPNNGLSLDAPGSHGSPTTGTMPVGTPDGML